MLLARIIIYIRHHEGHEDPEGFFFMSFMLFMVKKAVSFSIYVQLMTLISP